MKNIKSKILVSLVCLSSLTACDSFLDQTVNGQLLEEGFYLTDDDAGQAVIGAYDMLGAEYNTSWASIYFVKTLPSDESNAGGANNGDQPGYQTLDDFTATSLNDKVVSVWSHLYSVIYRTNKIINRTEPATPLRERLIAEAKTLRAYAYFELVSLWGGVPLVLDEIDPANYTSTSRATAAEIYDQIEKDLGEAIPVLPVKSDYAATDVWRWSKGAAQALLGKAHLYQEEWSDAVDAFDDVITSDEYALEENLEDVFDESGEFGVESLFELSFTNVEKYNWGNFPWGGRPESNIHAQLMGPRADYYTKATGDSLNGGWGMNVAKKKIYDAFVAAGDVNRRRVTIFSEAELEANGGNWSITNAWDVEGYWQRKYGSFGDATVDPSEGTPELNYTTNFRLIRYADVLLMAAEANYRDGDEGTARTYLNMVRQRPGTNLAASGAAGTALFDAIVLERQLELAFEGHRFTDLVRWGLADQELGDLGYVEGTHNVLPIPYIDVTSYGLEQNFGY